jgi:hypothetical protein
MGSIARNVFDFCYNHGREIAKSTAVLSGSVCITMGIEHFLDKTWIYDSRSDLGAICFVTGVNAVAYAVSHVALRELIWPWLLENPETIMLRNCNAECEQAEQELEKAHHDFKDVNIELQGVKEGIEVTIRNLEAGSKVLENNWLLAKSKRDTFAKTSILSPLEAIGNKIELKAVWLTNTTQERGLAKEALLATLNKFGTEATTAKQAITDEKNSKKKQEVEKDRLEAALVTNSKNTSDHIIKDRIENANLDRLKLRQETTATNLKKVNEEIAKINIDIAKSKNEEALKQARAAYYINEQEAIQGAYMHHKKETTTPAPRIKNPEALGDNSLRSLEILSLEKLQDLKKKMEALKEPLADAAKNAEDKWIKTAKELTNKNSEFLIKFKYQLLYFRNSFLIKIKHLEEKKKAAIQRINEEKDRILVYQEEIQTKIKKKQRKLTDKAKYPNGNPKIPAFEAQYKKETEKVTEKEEQAIKAGEFFDKLIKILYAAIREIEDLKLGTESGVDTLNKTLDPPNWIEAAQYPRSIIDRSIMFPYRQLISDTVQDNINEYTNFNKLNAFLYFKFNSITIDAKKTIEELKVYEPTLIEQKIPLLRQLYKELKIAQEDYFAKIRNSNQLSHQFELLLTLYTPLLAKHEAYEATKEKLTGEIKTREAGFIVEQQILASAEGRLQALLEEQDKITKERNESQEKKNIIKQKLADFSIEQQTLKREKEEIEDEISEISKRLKAQEDIEATAKTNSAVINQAITSLAQLEKLDGDFQLALEEHTKEHNRLLKIKAELEGRTNQANKNLPLVKTAQEDKRKKLEAAKKKRFEAIQSLASTDLRIALSNFLSSITNKCKAAEDFYNWKALNLNKTTSRRFVVHQATSHMVKARINLANLKRRMALQEALLTQENPTIPKTIELKYALAVYHQKKHRLDQEWRVANTEEKPAIRKAYLSILKKEEELLYDFFISKIIRGPLKKDQTSQTLREKCAHKAMIGLVEVILDKMLTERIRSKHDRHPYPYHTIKTLKKYLAEHINLIKMKDLSNTISSLERLKLETKLKEIKNNESRVVQIGFKDFLLSLASLADIKNDIANQNHKIVIEKLKTMKKIKGEELAAKYSMYLNKIEAKESLPAHEFPKFLESLTSLTELKDDILSRKDEQAIEKLRTLKEVMGDDLANSYESFLNLITSEQNKESEIAIKIEKDRLIQILIQELEPHAVNENKYLMIINEIIKDKMFNADIILNKIEKLKIELETIRSFHEDILNLKYARLINVLEANLSLNVAPSAIIEAFGGTLDTIVRLKSHVPVEKIQVFKEKLSLIEQYNNKPYLEDHENQIKEFGDKKNIYAAQKYAYKKMIETAEEKYFDKIIKDKNLRAPSSSKEKKLSLNEKVSYYAVPTISLIILLSESLKQASIKTGRLSFEAGIVIWGIMTGVHLCIQTTFPRAHYLFQKTIPR